ncbi:hypothetical protein MPLDJ20_100048 [Mesorhizobium plurifarium]|uniref:Uncharacterized protein n=1 Tax=Mesorhizobium plurifarium TaxID=69974 RepID=A0A090DEP2_MESPL|nr:hypothetical protein MPLDJ20_100048 [Mesorhizobium plurifarium]CDX38795.1 hypothetical protein MPLSOD_340049 [Mesorhizobium sp. SOD10]
MTSAPEDSFLEERAPSLMRSEQAGYLGSETLPDFHIAIGLPEAIAVTASDGLPIAKLDRCRGRGCLAEQIAEV